MATARKLALEPDEQLATKPATIPTALLAKLSIGDPAWPALPQPDGSAVLMVSPDRNGFTDEGVLFCIDASLALRWARHALKPKSFTGPAGVVASYIGGPGVIAWVDGTRLHLLNVFTGEDLPAIPFPEAWRALFQHPSVLLPGSPVYVKAGTVWRWDGHAFVKADVPALRGAHAIQAAGNEIWVSRINARGVEVSRLSLDFAPIGRATAPAMPVDARWALAFAGESACALVVGRGVSMATAMAGKLTEVFRLPSGKAQLVAFGAEGFTFVKPGGGVQRFDLAGALVLDGA